MKIKISLYLFFIGAIIFFSCQKEEVSTSLFPGVYTFKGPNLFDKAVFAVDTFDALKPINDTLGTFDRSNEMIADSINKILDTMFIQGFIYELDFINGNEVFVTTAFARKDSTGKTTLQKLKTDVPNPYSLVGNNIIISGFENQQFAITSGFLEVIQCFEFTLRSFRDTTNMARKLYFFSECNDFIPRNSAQNIINSEPTRTYDTISVEYVNLIFGKY